MYTNINNMGMPDYIRFFTQVILYDYIFVYLGRYTYILTIAQAVLQIDWYFKNK